MMAKIEPGSNRNQWLRDVAWGFFLYLLSLTIIFFILAQTGSDFIYVAF